MKAASPEGYKHGPGAALREYIKRHILLNRPTSVAKKGIVVPCVFVATSFLIG
jgi:hypothetical protein